MDELIKTEREQALELDQKIKVYANLAWTNLIESAKCLKKMRDSKLYQAMGFETFEEYTVQSLNIKERQAYTYIKAYEDLGERFLQSNANLGITKLSLLSAVPAPDREDLVEQHDLAGMTVEEVKKLVAENDARGEQIALLTEEKEETGKKIAALERELEEEKTKPVEVAVKEPSAEEIQKIKDAARKEAEKAMKEEKKKLSEKHKAELEQAEQRAKAEKERAVEEYAEKIRTIDAAKADAIRRAEELEKKLTVAASPETVKFQFYFEEWTKDFTKIKESLSEIRQTEPETAEKFTTAVKKYIEIIREGMEK